MYLPPRGKPDFPPAPAPSEGQNFTVDKDLRSWLETNEEVVTTITKPVQAEHIGAISAQSEGPVVFENIVGNPGDPSGTPIPGDPFNRVNGKMGIDATVKSRLNEIEFDRVWPKDWFEQDIRDYLDDT